MAQVEVPADMQISKNNARVTVHQEDMLTLKNPDASWQFGKVVNLYDATNNLPALVVSLKEHVANAILL